MTPPPKGWPRISAAVYYQEPAKAIDWLCNAFGFEVRLKIEGEGGRIEHSELEYAGGVIMVATAGEVPSGDAAAERDGQAPGSVGGGNTQNMFVYVDDIEAHIARARAAGATIATDLKVSDYGEEYWSDRSYECVDVGGHHWWFAQRLGTGAGYAPKLDSRDLGPNPPPKGWPRISSSLHYANASAAIDWLCNAFGFEVQLKVEGEGGQIEHAELVLGGGLIMPGDAARGLDKYPYWKAPDAIGGANTQRLMVYVDDVDALCKRARAAGATITSAPSVSDYGEEYWADRSCGIRDIGGHHWWFTQRLRG